MTLANFALKLTYAYLLRIPLLTIVALVGFPILAFFTGFEALFRGVFDLDNGMRIFWVSVVAFATAWSAMVVWRLIVVYGPQRFKLARPGYKHRLGWLLFMLWGAAALPCLWGMWVESSEVSAPVRLAAMAGALLLVLTGLWSASWVQSRLNRPKVAEHIPDLTFPRGLPFLDAAVERARRGQFSERLALRIDWVASRIPPVLGRGYLDYSRSFDRGLVAVLPGHVMAAVTVTLVAAVYIVLGFNRAAPSLAYVLMLFLILCWALGGCAYFLDRYRVPALLPLLALGAFSAASLDSDYYYQVQEIPIRTQADLAVSPGAALRGAAPERKSAIVVAATGGGIQASAWAAKVLTELDKASREEAGLPPFHANARLLSGVSGGSVGMMYYLDSFHEDGPATQPELDGILEAACCSSLDPITWALVFRDLPRTIFPRVFQRSDNSGDALEIAWMQAGREDADCRFKYTLARPLSSWRAGVRAGWRPASTFGATLTDTGERLALTTSPLSETDTAGREQFSGLFDFKEGSEMDIAIATAARLSASFTYVTPVSRASIDGDQFHIADGGYYDNYGMSVLLEWLNEALQVEATEKASGELIRDVLVIQIRSSRDADPLAAPQGNRGWFYQTFAPLAMLMNVRNAGQAAHRDFEFDLLKEKWERANPQVNIKTVVFTFDPKECESGPPPLSWHLTEQQRKAIDDAWLVQAKNRDAVLDFLRKVGYMPASRDPSTPMAGR